MNREMAAMFPNGIRALIVDDHAKFIKSSSMLLSLLNIKVASCGSPTAALKFFSGDKNKDVDVVLINAEKAATCGFDFRRIVETDLAIPVIYYLSRDHVATGDEADELLRTLGDATYILRSPLEATEVCDLWMVIAWRKCYLENKAKGADDGRRVVPAAAVQAYMAGGGSSSNTAPVDEESREDHQDRVHFKVVGAGRRPKARKRKSGCNTGAGAAAGSSGTTVAGDQAARRKGKKNVTAEHEMDDVPSQQQPAATATQKSALPLVPQQQQQPAAATTIEAITTTTPPAAGNVAPPTGVANMATTVTFVPEFSGDGNQQHQQNVCPQLMFGPFLYQGPRPPALKQAMPSMPLPRYSGTDAGAGATVGASAAAGAGEYGNGATSLLPTLNHGTETGGHDELAAMMAAYTESNHPAPVANADDAATAAMDNSSSALMALQRQNIGHSVAANRAEAAMDALKTNNSFIINYSAAAARQEVPNNGDDISTYSTSLMAPTPNNQVLDMASNLNELTVAGAAFFSDANDDASFTAPPQGLAAGPDGDQLAQGALDAISASLMGSPGPCAATNGNPGLELDAMFSPDQYDNTMFPLEALLGLDEAPVYETGVDCQQGGGAAGGTTGDDAAGTSLIGGADGNLDVLNDYMFMDNTEDFNNNGRE